MQVVANLFSLVSDDRVRGVSDRTLDEVGEETMELCTGVRWPRKATATETGGPHPEISPVFLNYHVGGKLRGAKQAMQALVDTH